MSNFELKKDKYRKARGGHSRLLSISCAKCGKHICHYQKDGPGILKRMYIDRIEGIKFNSKKNLNCPNCKELLAVPMIYKKENRPAYRMFVGTVTKTITKLT